MNSRREFLLSSAVAGAAAISPPRGLARASGRASGRSSRDYLPVVVPSGRKVPSHCYAVRFEGRELWGPDAGPRDAVYIDLFDEHLEPA